MYFWRICNLIASTNQKTYILRGLAKHAYIFQTTTLIISHYRDTIAGRPSQQKKLEKKIVMQNLMIDVKVSLLYLCVHNNYLCGYKSLCRSVISRLIFSTLLNWMCVSRNKFDLLGMLMLEKINTFVFIAIVKK